MRIAKEKVSQIKPEFNIFIQCDPRSYSGIKRLQCIHSTPTHPLSSPRPVPYLSTLSNFPWHVPRNDPSPVPDSSSVTHGSLALKAPCCGTIIESSLLIEEVKTEGEGLGAAMGVSSGETGAGIRNVWCC